jgi:hypothetical protein
MTHRQARCKECDWKSEPEAKKPKAALAWHRRREHRPPDATVAADGSGTHTTIQEAVDDLADGGVVSLKAGPYIEQIEVPSTPLRIVAEPTNTNGFTVLVEGESLDVEADRWTQGTEWTQFFRDGQEVCAILTAQVGEITKRHA